MRSAKPIWGGAESRRQRPRKRFRLLRRSPRAISGATLTKPRLAFQTVAGRGGRRRRRSRRGDRGERQKDGFQRRSFLCRSAPRDRRGQTGGRGEADGQGRRRGRRRTEGQNSSMANWKSQSKFLSAVFSSHLGLTIVSDGDCVAHLIEIQQEKLSENGFREIQFPIELTRPTGWSSKFRGGGWRPRRRQAPRGRRPPADPRRPFHRRGTPLRRRRRRRPNPNPTGESDQSRGSCAAAAAVGTGGGGTRRGKRRKIPLPPPPPRRPQQQQGGLQGA